MFWSFLFSSRIAVLRVHEASRRRQPKHICRRHRRKQLYSLRPTSGPLTCSLCLHLAEGYTCGFGIGFGQRATAPTGFRASTTMATKGFELWGEVAMHMQCRAAATATAAIADNIRSNTASRHRRQQMEPFLPGSKFSRGANLLV